MTRRARRLEPASPDELADLVQEMPERYLALILLAAWCGLRLGEPAELRRGDIDVTRGVLRITSTPRCANALAVVPLPMPEPTTATSASRCSIPLRPHAG